MLGRIDLNKTVDKKVYKEEMGVLEEKLAALQLTLHDMKIPVIISFEGWSAAGKGNLISKVVYPLDPRYFNVYTMNKQNEELILRPFLWSYWTKCPAKGRIAIFDKSWHRIILPESSEAYRLNESEKDGFFYDVNAFEKQLTDDGVLVIKLFLHISKEEQRRRFKELEKKPSTRWRVNENDWVQNRDYDQYISFFEQMIHQTNSGDSQWTIIESDDVRFATIKIYKTIINKITEEINRRKLMQPSKENNFILDKIKAENVSILSSVDLNKTVEQGEYKEKLQHYQGKISDLVYKLYSKRRAVAIVYEGWDAAGKGGNIKRLTEEMDPRGYEVVPIAAPSAEEFSHHYFWRFYNKLPKDGHVAIFDRSWYGRVMVERIEGFCTVDEWRRAYKEINDMERHWHNHGTIIFKFWLHIDKEEQLKRFKGRQDNPKKQYKITDEDWRNREKWDLYQEAVDEMLFRTNTEYAPWTVVESNDKKYARIKVLEHVVQELQGQLK